MDVEVCVGVHNPVWQDTVRATDISVWNGKSVGPTRMGVVVVLIVLRVCAENELWPAKGVGARNARHRFVLHSRGPSRNWRPLGSVTGGMGKNGVVDSHASEVNVIAGEQ